MKFILLDRILTLEPPERIVTSKSLSLAEEYLADHFPTFPVMPGVLMLEAMVQSAAWLVKVSQDFSKSMVVLEEAKNITYKSFITPGRELRVTIEAVKAISDHSSEFKGVGMCGDQETVKARFKLRHYNLSESNPQRAATDERLVADARKRFELLGGPSALKGAAVLVNNEEE